MPCSIFNCFILSNPSIDSNQMLSLHQLSTKLRFRTIRGWSFVNSAMKSLNDPSLLQYLRTGLLRTKKTPMRSCWATVISQISDAFLLQYKYESKREMDRVGRNRKEGRYAISFSLYSGGLFLCAERKRDLVDSLSRNHWNFNRGLCKSGAS